MKFMVVLKHPCFYIDTYIIDSVYYTIHSRRGGFTRPKIGQDKPAPTEIKERIFLDEKIYCNFRVFNIWG